MEDFTLKELEMDSVRMNRLVKYFLPINKGDKVEIESVESGLINHTFKVSIGSGEYILQRINTQVFPNPLGIQENINVLAGHLKKENYPRTVLSIVPTSSNELLWKDVDDSVWRMFEYVSQSSHYHIVPSTNHAFEAAKALGEFHMYLSSFDAEELTSPIDGFLDFMNRKRQFDTALDESDEHLKKKADKEIDFLEVNTSILEEYQQLDELLPKRVIHGDPKISNFLFTEGSNQVVCLIDWDTIMQGSVLYDFGDMVRSFTNRKGESELSTDAVFDIELFKAIKEGYLVHQKEKLSPLELDNLLLGAKTVIYVQAMRFLTDYLEGNTYFKTSYVDQNLDRTRNQIQLLKELLESEV